MLEENNSLYNFLIDQIGYQKNILNGITKKLNKHLTKKQNIILYDLIDMIQIININKLQFYKHLHEKDISNTVRIIANNMFEYEFMSGNTKFYVKLEEFGIPHKTIMEAVKDKI